MFGRRKAQPPTTVAEKPPVFAARDLPIAVYLNAPAVFDLLASREDGFSHLVEVETSLKRSDTSTSKLEGSVASSNLFQLLGVTLGGGISRQRESALGVVTNTQRIHTASSLFAKLRTMLRQDGLVSDLQSTTPIPSGLRPGAFVEVEATLKENPVIDTFDAFGQIAGIMKALSVVVSAQTVAERGPGGGKKPAQAGAVDPETAQTIRQIEGLAAMIGSGPFVDLIGLLQGTDDNRVVITSQHSFFMSERYSLTLDGQYRIFAKVLQIVPEGAPHGINLLRNTTFSRLQSGLFDALREKIGGANQAGISVPELITEIPGPTVLLLPVCIYA